MNLHLCLFAGVLRSIPQRYLQCLIEKIKMNCSKRSTWVPVYIICRCTKNLIRWGFLVEDIGTISASRLENSLKHFATQCQKTRKGKWQRWVSSNTSEKMKNQQVTCGEESRSSRWLMKTPSTTPNWSCVTMTTSF